MNTTKNKVSKCVMARIMRRGKTIQKNFTLRQYKTWPKAQAAADKWVASVKKELPPISPAKGRMSKRNSSGIVGVWPRMTTYGKGENMKYYCRWYARWPECPLKGGVSFSADQYGDDEAFAMAYLARTHETIDREWVLKKFKTFQKTKKYQEVVSKKQMEFA
jgi:hypothetical protein